MKILNYSILVLLIASCSYLKNVRLLTGGYIKRRDFVQELPFEYRKGLIVVKAKINNDTIDREFIFDTGAFNSKIEYGLAEQVGLETVTTKQNSTAQGVSNEIQVTRVDSINFGGTKFYNIGAGKLTYAEGSASPCIAKDGLIGANLIKLAHWKIDYQNRRIYFSDKPFKLPKDAELIPFERPALSATPLVEVKVEGREVSGLMFDTGFNGGLTMPATLSANFSTGDSLLIIDRSTTGIYGSNTDTLTVKRLQVSFASKRLDVPVEFSSLGKGLIGNEILSSYVIYIDNKDNQIALQQVSDIHMDHPLTFIPGVLNDSLWIVDRMKVSGDQRLMLGDTLSRVNGVKPDDVFADHCEYFMGIRNLIASDSITIQTLKGQKFIIQ